MASRAISEAARRLMLSLDELSRSMGTRAQQDGLYFIWDVYEPLLLAATTKVERERILQRMVDEVLAFLSPLFQEADQNAQSYINFTNGIYGLDLEPLPMTSSETLFDSISEFLSGYATNINAQLALGYDEQVFGDDDRTGFWTPSGLLRQFDFLLIALPASYFQRTYTAKGYIREDYHKEWMSILDAKTTQTCTIADGQIVPLDQPFKITGVPRFADRLQWPPAHYYCRSVVGLVPALTR